MRVFVFGIFAALMSPQIAGAADGNQLDVHPLAVAPFVALLLAIAFMPLFAGGFWHSNFRKALIVLLLAAPAAGYLFWLESTMGQPALAALAHYASEYVDFIVLLAALYTISGGIALEGAVRPNAILNTAILAGGAVLANVIGTTGASMVLIRPFLRINAQRARKRHLPVFFIFIVSNLGGVLTPLGDPPLFLGFLRGVDFFWTLHLWPQWCVGVGCVLAIFLLWDTWTLRREATSVLVGSHRNEGPPRVRGLINLIFLTGIVGAVLLQSNSIADAVRGWLNQFFACPDLQLVSAQEGLKQLWAGQFTEIPGCLVMVVLAVMSLLCTRRAERVANEFTWGPIIEVAVLFIGIFVTIVPAIALLAEHGRDFGITTAWQYFWITGGLSSFLDNAPTYLAFATVGAQGQNLGAFSMVNGQPNLLLQAISVGAVFMGANTYIGNGPNFMVKAIADEAGFDPPSFFGYMLYSIFILLPVFGLVTWLYFL